MNSVLNPEAPEFHPLLTSAVQDGYMKASKTIRTANTFPTGYSYDVFKTFPDFHIVTRKIRENVVTQSNQIMLKEVPSAKLQCVNWGEEENTEKIIDANDSLLDRININIDTLSGVNQASQAFISGLTAAWNQNPVITTIKVGSATFIGAKNIPRPQLSFKDHIDNSASLWVPKIPDKPNNIKPLALNILYNDEGEPVGYEHPYKVELELYSPPAWVLEEGEEAEEEVPAALDLTPLTMVDSKEKLDALVDHLLTVREIAVDLEHHSYRTYQGITCLIQMTTNEGGDFIVDALAIREHIHKLNLPFTDPKIIKVFHGAESDVVWLQRDFGVYVVGLVDTHQAARLLSLPQLSLKHLLARYCGVAADKRYQLADWRMRPLPAELVTYARADTHYLLYVWRRMRRELAARRLLRAAVDNSTLVAAATYNKPRTTDSSHLPLYARSRKDFTSRQLAALRTLYRWRDERARELDESTTYLLPNHMLLALAEQLPRELQGVLACCNPTPPFVKQNLLAMHRIILSCRELGPEPALYVMPAAVQRMLTPRRVHLVHDLTHALQGELPIDLEIGNALVSVRSETRPDVLAFDPRPPPAPAPAPAHPTIDLTDDDSSSSCIVVSDLNANAEMFVPPYDRYRLYRAVKQANELKEIKEKQAKVSAISAGDELIRREVLESLQRAELAAAASAPSSASAESSAPAPASTPAAADTEDDSAELADDDDSRQTKRKRKIIEKCDAPAGVTRDTRADRRHDTTLYDNVNYKKFHSGTDKQLKQHNIKFNKS